MRFDHLVHWVPDREAAVAAYREAGLHVVIGGEHPGWGSHNALCHFGLSYIEIVALHDPALAPLGPASVFRQAEDLIATGGGALTFALSVFDIHGAVAKLWERGIWVSDPAPGRRRRPDGSAVAWRTAGIADGPAWRPFLIEWEEDDPVRLAGLRERGIDAPHPDGATGMRYLMITCPDPAADAAWCGRLVGETPRPDGAGWRVELPGCDLRFRPGAETRVTAVGLEGLAGLQPSLFGLAITSRPG